LEDDFVQYRKFVRQKNEYYLHLKSSEDLYEAVVSRFDYLTRPYGFFVVSPKKLIVYDRGLIHYAKKYRAKIIKALKSLPKKRLKVKGKRSFHMFITVTLSRKYHIGQAWRKIIKSYVRRVMKTIEKIENNRVLYYIGVLEAHKDGYPHIHLLVVFKKPLKVFRWKNSYRFENKRSWDQALGSNEENFIDVFALRSHREIRSYLLKYLSKSLAEHIIQNKDDIKTLINSSSYESFIENGYFKDLTLLICKLLGVKPIMISRSLEKKIVKKRSKVDKNDPYFKGIEELRELGRYIVEEKPKNLDGYQEKQEEIRRRLDYIIQNFSGIRELYTRCIKIHPLYPAKCELDLKALIEAAIDYYENRVIFFFGRIKLIAEGSSLG